MTKEMCYSTSQKSDDSGLGKLYREGNISKHAQGCDIFILSNILLRWGVQ
jgi:hypothetical protein